MTTRSAQRAYDGYAKYTGGKTFDGRPMPTWGELPERIQWAWHSALGAALGPEIESACKTMHGLQMKVGALSAALDAAATALESAADALDGYRDAELPARHAARAARAVLASGGETGGETKSENDAKGGEG